VTSLELLDRLRRAGVELYTWQGKLYYFAPKGTMSTAALKAIDEKKVEIASILNFESKLLRINGAEKHYWLLRRGTSEKDPPLVACGSEVWCDKAMRTATRISWKEYSRWIVLNDDELGPLVADARGNFTAPAVTVPSQADPAGPAGVPAVVLHACDACVLRMQVKV